MKHIIYFAGGCFWGTQRFFQLIDGVIKTRVGYANGNLENPDYKTVCTGVTNAAETVEVIFDTEKIDVEDLVDLYFKIIDPTSLNKQGEDTGTQYRTGIYYLSDEDKPRIMSVYERIAESYSKPLAVEVLPLENFYDAEDYHQDYLINNPGGYCHVSQNSFILARTWKKEKK